MTVGMITKFLPHNDFSISDSTLEISGEDAKHLTQVLRVKKEEKIKLLNGKGQVLLGHILEAKKNHVSVFINEKQVNKRLHHISLALGITKRESFESSLKMATELGIASIYPLVTEYSGQKTLKESRVESVIKSAMEQSENTYYPEVFEPIKLENLDYDSFSQCFCFGFNKDTKPKKISSEEKILIMIGPEGGFSESEESFLKEINHLHFIHLKSPILRAPTAVAAASGYILSQVDN